MTDAKPVIAINFDRVRPVLVLLVDEDGRELKRKRFADLEAAYAWIGEQRER